MCATMWHVCKYLHVAASAKKTNNYTRCVRSNWSLFGGLCKKISTKNLSKNITIFWGAGQISSIPATSWLAEAVTKYFLELVRGHPQGTRTQDKSGLQSMKTQPSHDYNNNNNEIAKATHLPCPTAKDCTIFMRSRAWKTKPSSYNVYTLTRPNNS